jgi:hypothetical protein
MAPAAALAATLAAWLAAGGAAAGPIEARVEADPSRPDRQRVTALVPGALPGDVEVDPTCRCVCVEYVDERETPAGLSVVATVRLDASAREEGIEAGVLIVAVRDRRVRFVALAGGW